MSNTAPVTSEKDQSRGEGQNAQSYQPPPPAGYSGAEGGYYPPPPGQIPGYPPAPYYPPQGGMPYYPPPVTEKLSEVEKLDKNNTLYVKNLNTKIKIEYLRQSLETVFGQYGKLLEIHIKRNFRLRGQAFLVFDSDDAAEKALTAMDGAIFYHKPLKINYARKMSDVIAKRKGVEVTEEEKARREDNEKKFHEWVDYIRNLRAQEKLNKLKNEQNELMAQNDKKKGFDDSGFGDMGGQMSYPGLGDVNSNSLSVRNLPTHMNQISLHGIFSHYPGFMELRISPTKESATVYYNTSAEASAALMGKLVI